MSADAAFTLALAAGWVALVIAFAWPTPKCDYRARCSRCREWSEQDAREGRIP